MYFLLKFLLSMAREQYDIIGFQQTSVCEVRDGGGGWEKSFFAFNFIRYFISHFGKSSQKSSKKTKNCLRSHISHISHCSLLRNFSSASSLSLAIVAILLPIPPAKKAPKRKTPQREIFSIIPLLSLLLNQRDSFRMKL